MKISILSFSYKRGLPEDASGNGGGFVFDCRAMPNPFWDEALRSFSGCDKPVVDFFEQHKDMVNCFLDAAEVLVRQSADQYQKDGREHLQVAFGCTGGQHRSVYFAERMAERLIGIYGVEVVVAHAARKYWKIRSNYKNSSQNSIPTSCLSNHRFRLQKQRIGTNCGNCKEIRRAGSWHCPILDSEVDDKHICDRYRPGLM